MNLDKKVAIVTGSGQGIGRGIAHILAQHGASVVINDINSNSANEVAAELKAKNNNSIAIPANITISEEVNHLVEQTISSLGQIDILVNNAGINKDSLLIRMSDSDWDQILDTNLKGAFLCARAVLSHMMKQRWGRIINIASVVGIMGNPGQAHYAASKAGLIGLTKTIAREVASRGITANAIAPGFIDNGMTKGLSETQREMYQKQIPVGYFGLPKDVAHAAAFLASDEARYITGQVIHVNGGMMMV
ncbi:3-oxoacyl-[acyl-carrier-protein] reductase [Chloroflexota bacterium]